jgi:hypothetical protein
MARIETDPNYTTPTFSRATAATDIFKKEDVQNLASAVSTHDHAATRGLAVARIAAGVVDATAIADGSITSTEIADLTIIGTKIANGTIPTAKLDPAGIAPVLAAADPPAPNQLTRDSILKGWSKITFTGGVPVSADDFNVAGVVDNGVGNVTITWELDFTNAVYAAVAACRASSAAFATIDGYALGSIAVRTWGTSFVAADFDFQILATGDQ